MPAAQHTSVVASKVWLCSLHQLRQAQASRVYPGAILHEIIWLKSKRWRCSLTVLAHFLDGLAADDEGCTACSGYARSYFQNAATSQQLASHLKLKDSQPSLLAAA